jgi:predicted O-linked N-acetylglucosamine transferase (SPINDLY family)
VTISAMATMSIEQALALGVSHHDAGRLPQAESIYRQILSRVPDHPETLRMLSLLAFQVGRAADALPLIERAIKANPSAADYHANLGVILAALNRHNDAIQALRQSMVLNPTDPETMVNLGNVLLQRQRHDEAIDFYRRAIASGREVPEAHYNLGKALEERGDLDGALAAYMNAVALNPANADAYNNLGNVLQRKGRASEAIDAYRRAIAAKAEFPEAHFNLGRALHDTGKIDQEIDEYQKAISQRPEFHNAYNNLGNALRAKGRSSEAIDAYRRAISVKPQFPEAWNNLGNTLLGKGQLDEAISAYREALSQKSDYAMAYNNLASAYKDSGKLDEALDLLRKAAALSDDPRVTGNLLYTLHFHQDSTPKSLFDEHVKWNERFAKPVAASHPVPPKNASQDRRLRIGYVSPNFREHPVGRFMLALLANHDHTKFEIYCYTDLTVPDRLTEQFKSLVHFWKPTAGLSDAQLADLIRSDSIDILVDLTMHMNDSRLMAFARRPAPVQLTYLAYCSTTGLETMDYRLSDPHLDPPCPPSIDESHYTEKTIRLPRTYWCYPEPETPTDIGPLPVSSAGHITFGCFNNYSKVTHQTLELWARVLNAVAQSRLIIHSHEGSHRQVALDLFASQGIDPTCVQFQGFRRMSEYLSQYNQIDIALDPFPYGGGTTTCDAIYMGVPVVSLEGTTAVSRAGRSILTNVVLADLVAKSPDQYVEIASRLAQDLPRLEELRRSLRQRLKDSPLMDAVQFARDIEESYYRIA